MGKFTLKETGNTNIQTSFRYEVIFPTVADIGMTDYVTGYCTSSGLPKVNNEPIAWYLPGGMKNNQAGKGTPEPVDLEFVVPSSGNNRKNGDNIIALLESWSKALFNLNDGTNIGKEKYAVDGIKIQLKTEGNKVAHTFILYKAFPTTLDYGTVGSETSELIKCKMTLLFDQKEYVKG